MDCRLKLFMILLCVCLGNLGQGEADETEIVKTIQREEGDVMDCIDINKQPSLKHPLLKSHKIQVQPLAAPTEISTSVTFRESLPLRSIKETCPLGTVPIHRTTERDIRRAKALARELSPSFDATSDGQNRSKSVGIMTTPSQTPIYFGVFGRASVYNLTVEQDQTSATCVWLNFGQSIISLIAGSLVAPAVTGDSISRLFVYWRGNNLEPCYSTTCKGFVQVSREISPNDPIRSLSIYGGQTQDVKFSIFQDRRTGNWWFDFNDNHIGYWPKEIVPYFNNGSTVVGMGGIAQAGNTGLSPPIGSGHLPDGQYNHAAYFKQFHYIDERLVPHDANGTQEVLFGAGCYGLKDDGNSGDQQWGYRFLFGGPGGPC